jgi:DNA-binding response OmpR family regulator
MGKENRILIVDDEIVIRELMTDILQDEGFATCLRLTRRQRSK